MKRHPSSITSTRAKDLRKSSGDVERRFWRLLRQAFPWTTFRRQVPIDRYIADFACHAAKLVIELDGSRHADQRDYDRRREQIMASHGYLVVRFWNHEVSANPDGVLQTISDHLASRGLSAPPLP
ncbi:MAG: DUF559 domain-containing protein [Alphaproteobacteria bacterium]|nr:DUF559 domain-containing protein [Alphaproteobacteria bacterium]